MTPEVVCRSLVTHTPGHMYTQYTVTGPQKLTSTTDAPAIQRKMIALGVSFVYDLLLC